PNARPSRACVSHVACKGLLGLIGNEMTEVAACKASPLHNGSRQNVFSNGRHELPKRLFLLRLISGAGSSLDCFEERISVSYHVIRCIYPKQVDLMKELTFKLLVLARDVEALQTTQEFFVALFLSLVLFPPELASLVCDPCDDSDYGWEDNFPE